MIVPFLDLKAQYQKIKEEIKVRFDNILNSCCFVLGPEVEEFEKNFAEFCEAKYCVACNSGTSAIHLALLSSGVKKGDEVILPTHTFIASAESVSYCQAKPVFVDVDPKTYLLDYKEIESKITKNTKAVLTVHLYGQPVDIDPIKEICMRKNLTLVEDAAQAHGARYKNKRVGGLGNTACFSFYPGKNLGAYGEGGAVVTDNKDIADKIKILRDHGQQKKYHHDFIGFNYRMSAFQGAVLNVKLKYIDEWNKLRREKAHLYNELLKETKVITPFEPDYAESVYHLFIILSDKREELSEYLKENGVYTGLHYPVPIHLQKAYEFLGYKNGDFPHTERISRECLSLPMYPELDKIQIKYVCDLIKQFYKN